MSERWDPGATFDRSLDFKLMSDGYKFCLKCGRQLAKGEDLEKHRKYCEGSV